MRRSTATPGDCESKVRGADVSPWSDRASPAGYRPFVGPFVVGLSLPSGSRPPIPDRLPQSVSPASPAAAGYHPTAHRQLGADHAALGTPL